MISLPPSRVRLFLTSQLARELHLDQEGHLTPNEETADAQKHQTNSSHNDMKIDFEVLAVLIH